VGDGAPASTDDPGVRPGLRGSQKQKNSAARCNQYHFDQAGLRIRTRLMVTISVITCASSTMPSRSRGARR
jgi:hypothetical protein